MTKDYRQNDYSSPCVEMIEMNEGGILCLSDVEVTNPWQGNTEEEW